MACACESENALLGALSLPPIKKGMRFQFGYNTGYGTGPFEASDIAGLTNAQGITQDAVSYVLSGTLSYYVAIEGKAGRDYASATDLRDAIYQAIVAGGYSIDPGSINFNPEVVAGAGQGPQVIYTGPGAGGGAPSAPGSNFFDQIAASLNVTRDTAQIAVIGGAVLLLVLVMKK
jgi:hypothetical protein